MGVGDGDGDGEATAADLLVDGTGDGDSILGSEGTGLNTGVGVGSALAEADGVGVGSTESDGLGVAEIVGVEVSGAGVFSSAKVGASFAKTRATRTRKINLVVNLPFRVCRRSPSSCAFIGEWYRAKNLASG